MMWVEEPVLLWLWRRSAAAAQIRPLAMPWVRPSKKDTHTESVPWASHQAECM